MCSSNVTTGDNEQEYVVAVKHTLNTGLRQEYSRQNQVRIKPANSLSVAWSSADVLSTA